MELVLAVSEVAMGFVRFGFDEPIRAFHHRHDIESKLFQPFLPFPFLLLKHSVVEVFLDIVRHLFDRNWLHVLFVLSLLLLKHLPNLPLTDRLLLFLVARIEPIRNRYGHIELFPRLKIIGVSDLFELVFLSLLFISLMSKAA